MKNISLTIFTICLILFNGINSFSTKFNSNTNIKSKFTSKDDDKEEEKVTSLPTFKNKGFKCMSFKPTVTVKPEYCANAGQLCISKGIVLMGPLKDKSYGMFLKDNDTTVKCDTSTFNSKETSSGKRCFTHDVTEPDTAEKDEDINSDDLSHRACVKGDQKVATLIKQGAKAKCDKDTFGTDAGNCSCYRVSIPFDTSLTSLFYPVRFNTDGIFQCISANLKYCSGLNKDKTCLAVLNAAIKNENIIKANQELNETLYNFFFNRWICPNESGLDVAIEYASEDNGKTYNINCLTRNGIDCLDEGNAQSFCERTNSCEEAKKEAKQLTCGSKIFKDTWFNDGFSTKVHTWCKAAGAWLRFDGFIEVTKTAKKIGLVLLPNGQSGCVPAVMKPTECLIENDQGILRKTIDFYMENPTNFGRLIKCEGDIIRRTKDNPTHWCSNSILNPDDNGNFKSALEFNLFVAIGKKPKKTEKTEQQMGAQEKFSAVVTWQDFFGKVTKIWGKQYDKPRFYEDVNGDGIKDIIGYGEDGVYVSLGNDEHGFGKSTIWNTKYSVKEYNRNFPKFLADINKDGKFDIVVFGKKCVEVAYSDGKKFGETACLYSDFGYKSGNKGQGWKVDINSRFITDVNGDGYPDIVGFGDDDISIVMSDEGSFTKDNRKEIKNMMTYKKGGWNENSYPRFVEDVDGDGCKDIVGFGQSYTYVILGNKKCDQWKKMKSWTKEYSKSKGYKGDKNPRFLVDVNKDGKMDIVGFEGKNILTSISNGKNKFELKGKTNQAPYNVKKNNIDTDHHIIFEDVNADKYPDLVFIGKDQILVGINDKRGNFKDPEVWSKEFKQDDGIYKDKGGMVFFKDLNGNELLDLISIENDGIYTSKNFGNKFDKKKYIVGSFSNGVGNTKEWEDDKHLRFFTDVNGDGLPDAVAYTDNGILVNINKKEGFQGDRIYTTNMTKGWDLQSSRFVIDLNNDGKADLIGFGSSETEIIFNDGDKFDNKSSVSFKQMSDKDGWSNDKHFRTIVDLNNDGFPDILGCGNDATYVLMNKKNNKFGDYETWTKEFSIGDGWRNSDHIRMVADVNGDGFVDLVGFNEKVYVALNDKGNKFKAKTDWSDDFGIDEGWSVEQHPRFLVDVNGDKLLDIVGFGDNGVKVALNQDGKSFQDSEIWSKEFGKKSGWLTTLYKRYLIDVNKDGKADIVAFGKEGVYVSLSTGKAFEKSKLWIKWYGNKDEAGDWNNSDVRDILDINGDGFPDAVGIKDDNIQVALNMLK